VCNEFRGYKGTGEREEGVKKGSDVRSKIKTSRKKEEEDGEALQTGMNAMDRSQRDDDRKEREREGERTETIREGGKSVCNGFSQWDGGKREGKRGRATR